jgi:hypothetical protein
MSTSRGEPKLRLKETERDPDNIAVAFLLAQSPKLHAESHHTQPDRPLRINGVSI